MEHWRGMRKIDLQIQLSHTASFMLKLQSYCCVTASELFHGTSEHFYGKIVISLSIKKKSFLEVRYCRSYCLTVSGLVSSKKLYILK